MRTYPQDEQSFELLNLSSDFDLDHNTAIQSFHKTIQLIKICRILHCDLDLEDRKNLFERHSGS